jgi:hypothetical protein
VTSNVPSNAIRRVIQENIDLHALLDRKGREEDHSVVDTSRVNDSFNFTDLALPARSGVYTSARSEEIKKLLREAFTSKILHEKVNFVVDKVASFFKEMADDGGQSQGSVEKKTFGGLVLAFYRKLLPLKKPEEHYPMKFGSVRFSHFLSAAERLSQAPMKSGGISDGKKMELELFEWELMEQAQEQSLMEIKLWGETKLDEASYVMSVSHYILYVMYDPVDLQGNRFKPPGKWTRRF